MYKELTVAAFIFTLPWKAGRCKENDNRAPGAVFSNIIIDVYDLKCPNTDTIMN